MDVNEVIIIEQRDRDLRAPDFESFALICRICLAPCSIEPTKQCKNIHDEESQMNIRSLIEVYTYVKIPQFEDALPQNICNKCLEFLITMHTFRSRCRINDNLLKKIYQRTKVKTESSKETTLDALDIFSDQTNLLINKINDERMGVFQCKDCNLICNSKKALTIHRNAVKHSRRPASKCPYCEKMFNTSVLVQHLRVHTKEKPFSCETCGVAFAIKNNLKRHMKIHAGKRSYTCEECGKSFLRSETLKEHSKRHKKNLNIDKSVLSKISQNQEVHSCDQCDKKYATAEQLKIHRRYHQKTFLCPDCGKVFSTKANWITHVRVHTGEKPYVCTVCFKRFSQSSSLRTHQVVHTGDKAFECETCNRKFSVRGNLKAHERTHTGQTPHQCAICKKGFCTSSTLRKHLRRHDVHQDKTEDEVVENEKEPSCDDVKVSRGLVVKNNQVYVVDNEQEILIGECNEEHVVDKFEHVQIDEEEIQVVYGGLEEVQIEFVSE